MLESWQISSSSAATDGEFEHSHNNRQNLGKLLALLSYELPFVRYSRNFFEEKSQSKELTEEVHIGARALHVLYLI
jgi:hypothetical protein